MKQIHILETVLISDTVNIDRHNAHKQELFGVVNNFYEAKEVTFFETKKFQKHCP